MMGLTAPAAPTLERPLVDLGVAGWQTLLDRHAAVFSEIQPGSRIGLMSKDDFEPPEAALLVWEATGGGMRAKYESFPGFDAVAVDLLLIADDATIRNLHDSAHPDPLAEMKRKVRRRDILLFVVKPRHQLIDNGYSEFLDCLGLVFMGTCR
ncbi:MAG TPA: hypothetical protein VGF60_00840 [Xanthobacteraceae bacterium]|jgi:hypothetical protein